MKHNLKLALLSALALAAAPFVASAHPAIPSGGLADKVAAPIVKAGCYYEGCEEEVYIRRRCWHYGCGGYRDYDRDGYPGYGWHGRYRSHYRWGSYHRYWRPRWCCGDDSGWGD